MPVGQPSRALHSCCSYPGGSMLTLTSAMQEVAACVATYIADDWSGCRSNGAAHRVTWRSRNA
eukprot:10636831-Alexandrium_andersonii.AAC.1